MPAFSGAMAGLGALSSLGGGLMSMHGQSSANSMSNKMALRQMMFQRDMANTAHRREVNDLRKAGLNPILSGTGGAGAASPTGAKSEYANEAGAGVASAMDALAKVTDALVSNQQAKKIQAETELTKARTLTEAEQPAAVRAGVAATQEGIGLTKQNINTARALERNYMADTLIKEIGPHVQMSEINKNNALTGLFHKQGITQDMQAKLLDMNVAQADQVLKRLKLDGAITEDGYNLYKSFVTEPLGIMTGTDWKGDLKFHYDRGKRALSDFNEDLKAKARAARRY